MSSIGFVQSAAVIIRDPQGNIKIHEGRNCDYKEVYEKNPKIIAHLELMAHPPKMPEGEPQPIPDPQAKIDLAYIKMRAEE